MGMIIDYIGTERCDILYYLLRVSAYTGKKVLAIDNSISGDLFHIYQKEDRGQIVSFDRVTIMRNKKLIPNRLESFDYIFLYEGMYSSYEGPRDYTIFAPTCNAAEWKWEKGFSQFADPETTYLILRDKCTGKIGRDVVEDEFEIKFEDAYELSLDDVDMSNYVALTHNKVARLPKKGDVLMVTRDFAEKLFEMDAKAFKKISKVDK